MHMAATLQGIVNRDKPCLFVKYVKSSGIDTDQYWWNKYISTGKWLSGTKVYTVSDPVTAAGHFKEKVKGLVVYDSKMNATSNLASTVAGVEDLIAVRYDTRSGSMFSKLINKGWEIKRYLVNKDGSSMFSTKTDAYKWAVGNYLKTGKCNAEYAAYYIDQYWRGHAANAVDNHHLLVNHDFFVSKRAFFFDLSPWADEPATDTPDQPAGADYVTLKEALSEIYRLNGGEKFCHIGGFPSWPFKYSNANGIGGKHSPVETEWEFARIIGDYNAFKDADAASFGAMANASFWQHYPLKNNYPQKWVERSELVAKGFLTSEGKVDRTKKYCLIYIGDYDAASWLYQCAPAIWDDPVRGQLPMTWAISPVLERRAPMAMEYLWESATANDYFVAADNGAGYLCPGSLEEPRAISGLPSGVEAWKRHCTPFYKRWDITVSGFIIDGLAKAMSENGFRAYSEFSPNGICPMVTPGIAQLVNGMPVFRAGANIDTGNVAEAASFVATNLSSHPEVPFYWFRTVLKSPSWHLELKKGIEAQNKNAVWLSGPEFFELLRCYLEESKE